MADKLVTMVHPKLPGREIQIRAGAVKSRERSGWKVKTQETATTAASKKGDS